MPCIDYHTKIDARPFAVPEEKFLRTIELEEQFGGKTYQAKQSKEDKKKAKAAGKGAAIGFVYEDSTPTAAPAEDPTADNEAAGQDRRPVPRNLKSAPAGGPHFRHEIDNKAWDLEAVS